MPLIRLILAAVLAVGLSSAVQAQNARVVSHCSGLTVPAGDAAGLFVDGAGKLCVSFGASTSFSVAKTTGIGTTAVQVSAADQVNRRTVRNTGSVACEIMPAATAYGAGHPINAGESFTFDSTGRTAAALFVACSAAGGAVSVISY